MSNANGRTPDSEGSELAQPTPNDTSELVFTNSAPEDKEWSAHIRLLNEWTDPDRWLREIIQYARSGPHYPADMHVDLISQWHSRQQKAAVEAALKAAGEEENRYCGVCCKPCYWDEGNAWQCPEHGGKTLYITRNEAEQLRAGLNKGLE